MGEVHRLTVRPYEPGDEEAILDGFNFVFGRIDPAFEPRSLEAWRWQYLENPSGRRIFLGLDEDGQVVSQQAGIPVRMVHRGLRVTWNQIVDSFADPRYGKGLKRHRAFADVSKPYCDTYGGPHPEGDPIMYGLPIRAAWRMGHKFLGYEVCRSQTKLCVRPETYLERGQEGEQGVTVEEPPRFPAEVEALFERVQASVGAMAVRDALHLNWRFCDRPDRSYELGLARRAGTLIGLAVFGAGTFDGREDALLCDWLVPADEPGAGKALRRWAATKARERGLEFLTALFPDTSGPWIEFQEAGFRVQDTRYFTSCGTYSQDHPEDCSPRWLFHHWYYTMADFDLC